MWDVEEAVVSEIVRAAEDVVDLDGTHALNRASVGGKAWSINAMTAAGLPVPPGFAITTDVGRAVLDRGPDVLRRYWQDIRTAVGRLEQRTGKGFGDKDYPLLVSVRSGAPTSMPGMMDTLLNIGLTARTGDVVRQRGGRAFRDELARRLDEAYQANVGQPTPDDPWVQLHDAILAAIASWRSRRAVAYRNRWGVPHSGSTAVTVQAMVFGGIDDRSGTGVLFTRDPATGRNEPFGEWLTGRQSEDLVSGKADPQPLDALAAMLPDAHSQLLACGRDWERDRGVVQDIEFTVESGALYFLQSRAAKLSPVAACRIAVDFVDEGQWSVEQALDSISPMAAALLPTHDDHPLDTATGTPASPGWAVGRAVNGADRLLERSEIDTSSLILVTSTTSPDDLPAMTQSVAVVTETGGATSHAAVVCRELGLPCVVGVGAGAAVRLDGRDLMVDGSVGTVLDSSDASSPTSADESVGDPVDRIVGWATSTVGCRVIPTVGADDDAAVAAARQGAVTVCAEHPLAVLLRLRRHR